MTILVTGASGTVGRELVRLLAKRNVPVRALARTERPVDPHVEQVFGDLTRPATLRALMAGVERAYLITPAAPTEQHLYMQQNLLQAARAAGVQRVVAQSVQFAKPTAPVEVMRSHARCEQMLRRCRTGWTVLRPNSFMQNMLAFGESIRATATLPVAGTGVRLSLVDARDVAEVAATVLTGDDHDQRTYELTGPAALGFGELADQIAAATGRPVRYLPVRPDQMAAAMRAGGADEFAADTALAHLEYWRTGVGSDVNPTSARLLGRPPRTFATFASDHRASFTPEAA